MFLCEDSENDYESAVETSMAFSPQKDVCLQLDSLRINDVTKNESHVTPKKLEEEVFLDINDHADFSLISKESKEEEMPPSPVNEILHDSETSNNTSANEEIVSDVFITKREEIKEPEKDSSQEIDTPKEENVPQIQINPLDNNELEHISNELKNGSTVIQNEEVHMIRA
jgi:hypothetical protein